MIPKNKKCITLEECNDVLETINLKEKSQNILGPTPQHKGALNAIKMTFFMLEIYSLKNPDDEEVKKLFDFFQNHNKISWALKSNIYRV